MVDSSCQWSEQDHRFMAEAIELANRGLYTTDPNPRVGCILVRDGEIVGRGWHVRAGEGHAEVNAIADAGDRAKGAIAYVTLEPCSHYGRTPPCAKGLVDAGIVRVIAAMQDPNPQVAGKGFKILQDAGVDVATGLLESAAKALNPGFIKRMQTGMPYTRVKMAVSVDGRTAMASGESQWITGASARSDVQRLRARSSAVLSGIGTVRDDDAALSVRATELGLENSDSIAQKQPLRVVLDSQASLSEQARLLSIDGPILWVISEAAVLPENIASRPNIDMLRIPAELVEKRELGPILKSLADRECNEVLVEAGATLAGEFVTQGLWDELIIYIAPKLMGSEARPLAFLPFDKMSEAVELDLTDMRMVGRDIRLTYQPKR